MPLTVCDDHCHAATFTVTLPNHGVARSGPVPPSAPPPPHLLEQAKVKDKAKDSVKLESNTGTNDESDERGTSSFGAVKHADKGGAVEDEGQESDGGKGGAVKGEGKGGAVKDEGKQPDGCTGGASKAHVKINLE